MVKMHARSLFMAATAMSIGLATSTATNAANWGSSWTADPVGPTGIILPLTRTLREIISPHRAGTTVRLHLTNRTGILPVTFSQVWLGTQQDGAQLVAGSNKEFTFGGAYKVTIKPGDDVVSDPLTYTVVPFKKLAVSMQTGGLIPPLSSNHAVSREVNYFSLLEGAETVTGKNFLPFKLTAGILFEASWHYIAGLDTTVVGPQRTVVTFGDSITDGLIVNPSVHNTFVEDIQNLGLEQRWTDDLQRRFASLPGYGTFTVVNAGIAGNRLTAGPFAPFFGPEGLVRLDPDVIAVPGVTDVIMHMGINDIAFNIPAQGLDSHAIAYTLIAGYQQVITRLHAKHIRIILATMMPAKGAGYGQFAPLLDQVLGKTGLTGVAHGSEITDLIRRQVNTWILTEGAKISDGIIDFDACMRNPASTSYLNPKYNSGDNLHPNALGYQVMSNCIDIAKVFPL